MSEYKKILAICVAGTLLVACSDNEQVSDSSSAEVSAPVQEVVEPVAITHGNVTDERLKNAGSEPGQWLTYGGTYEEQRYSQLDQINRENVDQLGLAWYGDLITNRGQQATPIYVDGRIYITEAWSKVSAYDARTGEFLWRYDPIVDGSYGSKGCCDVVNRGVAVYEGKVYVGSYDGRLIAIDAETGEEVWTQVTVDQDPEKFYTVTNAPRVVNGKILMGMAGGEYNVRGYISAYDAETGDLAWRFYTVPGNPELGFENDAMRMAAETWTGNWWEHGGGGTTWDAMTFDPESNQVIFGTGNGSPWNPLVRSPDGGDNLFTVSIVAVDADTGEYRWHFQQIPAEEWDFDAINQITIAELEVDGEMRRVAMQASKNGYYYMLDVYTGELLRANNFVDVNWTFGYDLETGKPEINPAAQYTKTDVYTIIQPGPQGAHSWHPMSYSPQTGLLYIPAQETSMAFRNQPDNPNIGNFTLGVNFMGGEGAYEREGNTIPQGVTHRMVAWDPIAAEEVWAVENEGTGGILTTAGGLLFKPNSGGQEFVAYDVETGERLWSADTQAGGSPGAISYLLDGEQYIAHVVGGSGGAQGGYYAPSYARLLVYKLGGDAELPPKEPFTQRPISPPEQTASQEVIAMGEELYAGACATCHEGTRGSFPDLKRSPMLHSAAGFNSVVLGGSLRDRGMDTYEGKLTEEQTDAIRHYIISQAHTALNQSVGGGMDSAMDGATPEEEVDTHTTD